MCKSQRVDILCRGIEYSARTEERLREVLKHAQRVARKNKEEKTSPVVITNGMKTLEIFVGENNVGGWQKNGGTHEIPDFVRGIDEVVNFFKLSLAS